jgi:hypothetical protein
MKIKIKDRIDNAYSPSIEELRKFLDSRGFRAFLVSEDSLISRHTDSIIQTGYQTKFEMPSAEEYPVVPLEKLSGYVLECKRGVDEGTIISWLLVSDCEPLIYDYKWERTVFVPSKGHQVILEELLKFDFNDVPAMQEFIKFKIERALSKYRKHIDEVEERRVEVKKPGHSGIDDKGEFSLESECIKRLYWCEQFLGALRNERRRLRKIIQKKSLPSPKYTWKENNAGRSNPSQYNDDLDTDQQSQEWWDSLEP